MRQYFYIEYVNKTINGTVRKSDVLLAYANK